MRGEPITWGHHLRLLGISPGALGQRARRHYWLAPRSDDAVGAAGISSRALARLQQLDIGCRRFGLADWFRQRSGPAGAAGMPVGAGRAPVVPEA